MGVPLKGTNSICRRKGLSHFSLNCKLVPVQYQEYEYGLLEKLVRSGSLKASGMLIVFVEIIGWLYYGCNLW